MCEEKKSRWNTARIVAVHVLFWAYQISLWCNASLWEKKEENVTVGLSASSIVAYIFFTIYSLFLPICSDKKQGILRKSYFKFPTFTFVLCALYPYGFKLNQLYKSSETGASLPIGDYVQMQLAIPLILICSVFWPTYNEDMSLAKLLTLAFELMNAFDIMELIPDLWYLQRYELFWFVLYFVAMGVSALLISLPINEIDDDVEDRSFILLSLFKTVCTLVFTDVFFMVIRFKIMAAEGTAEYGLNMIMKNMILIVLRIFTIRANVKRFFRLGSN